MNKLFLAVALVVAFAAPARSGPVTAPRLSELVGASSQQIGRTFEIPSGRAIACREEARN
jgi:hypothetical protein